MNCSDISAQGACDVPVGKDDATFSSSAGKPNTRAASVYQMIFKLLEALWRFKDAATGDFWTCQWLFAVSEA
jgi:hypothetical protein